MAAGPVWLGASYALGRDVPIDEPYPHICGKTVTGTVTGRLVVLLPRECAACADRRRLRVVKGGAAS